MIRNILLTIFLCFGMTSMAQNAENKKWQPELGLELITEQQVTHEKEYNFANLLRLDASLPINSKAAFDIATISTFRTRNEGVGNDLQTFSNLDAENNILALARCGINWDINDHHTIFVGVHNMNEDYFASPVTSLFANSSCGIFPTLSANYDIANYPYASMGVHYRYTSESDGDSDSDGDGSAKNSSLLTLNFSLYNGQGYRNFAGRRNVFRVCPKDDGLFALTQIDYKYKGSDYFLGICGHKTWGSLPGPPRNEREKDMATTIWTYAEQRITRNLSLMAAYSHAFISTGSAQATSTAACTDFAGIGGKYSLGKSDLGVFSDYARYTDASEWATEITCKAELNSHFYIQPSAHFIVTRLTDAEPESNFHFAATLRVGLSL